MKEFPLPNGNRADAAPRGLHKIELNLIFRDGSAQRGHGLKHSRIEPLPALIEMRQDRTAHARIPKAPEMIGNIGDSALGGFVREEPPDLVGHIDKFFRRHVRTARRG